MANGLATARRVVETVCKSMNCTEIHHKEEPEGAGHILGTYRMGTNPADSVADAYQRTHDHPNLFLVGSGTLPTIGTANPTLTLVALAIRTADFAAHNFQSF